MRCRPILPLLTGLLGCTPEHPAAPECDLTAPVTISGVHVVKPGNVTLSTSEEVAGFCGCVESMDVAGSVVVIDAFMSDIESSAPLPTHV